MKRLLVVTASLVLAGCVGPNKQLEHIDVRKVPQERLAEAFKVQVFEGDHVFPEVSKTLGPIHATSCKNKTWDPPSSKGDALQQLRLKALELGAAAVVNVYFDENGTDAWGTNCWNSVTATGEAVIFKTGG